MHYTHTHTHTHTHTPGGNAGAGGNAGGADGRNEGGNHHHHQQQQQKKAPAQEQAPSYDAAGVGMWPVQKNLQYPPEDLRCLRVCVFASVRAYVCLCACARAYVCMQTLCSFAYICDSLSGLLSVAMCVWIFTQCLSVCLCLCHVCVCPVASDNRSEAAKWWLGKRVVKRFRSLTFIGVVERVCARVSACTCVCLHSACMTFGVRP